MNPEDLDRLLEGRRSVRKYRQETVPEEWLDDMIRCALHAPSPSNSQPVRFVLFKSAESRRRLQESMEAAKEKYLAETVGNSGFKRLRNRINYYYRHCAFMFEAPVLLAAGTAAEYSGFASQLVKAGLIGDGPKEETDLNISIGLALKGAILKACALGLGTCILTAPLSFVSDFGAIFPRNEVDIKCFLTAGFPAETPHRPERKTVGEIYRVI